ncbi:hypothetical protein PEX1_006150 [Penicillium expansum]|uniref:Uncharacterized protein n=1 Tax=Penicillium expansum TaxID=27334 RepID=A0A0A2JMZ5_PENEN|nr:hypothetical protein PEX2_062560 [Penicillium expansum]KGO53645.1 hypothetical protein PEX2_062560 [Penicillium expansum]KGO69889.1 hypothetical protein PEX1_006150 [Penicillium expansum]
MFYYPGVRSPAWMGLPGADVKYLLLGNFCYPIQEIDCDKLARLTGVTPKRAQHAFRIARENLLKLCAIDPQFMSIASQHKYRSDLEEISAEQAEKHSKHKKSKLLLNESDEESIEGYSESEIDDSRSNGHYQKAKRKEYTKRKGKGKITTLRNESENSEVEYDELSQASFKPASKSQRRSTKQKPAKQKRHTRYSTSHGVRKERDSLFHTDIKSSSTRAGRHNIQHNRGLKRDRNPYKYQDGSTERSSEESSSAEMNASSSRPSHGRAKGKRLAEPSGLADTLDNGSDMEKEVERRPARTYAKSTVAKTTSQTGNRKKLHKPNGLAESLDKDLVRGAMDGLTLDGDAPKTNGHAARTTKENFDEGDDSISEKNEEAHSDHD